MKTKNISAVRPCKLHYTTFLFYHLNFLLFLAVELCFCCYRPTCRPTCIRRQSHGLSKS